MKRPHSDPRAEESDDSTDSGAAPAEEQVEEQGWGSRRKKRQLTGEAAGRVAAKLGAGSGWTDELYELLLDFGPEALDAQYSKRLGGHVLADVVGHIMWYSGDGVLPQLKAVSLVCRAVKLGLYQVLVKAQSEAREQQSREIRPRHLAPLILAYGPSAVAQMQSYMVAWRARSLQEDSAGLSPAVLTTMAEWTDLFDGKRELAELFHSTEPPNNTHLEKVAARSEAMTQPEYEHFSYWNRALTFRGKGRKVMLEWLGWSEDQLGLSKRAFDLLSLLARRLVADITHGALEAKQPDAAHDEEVISKCHYDVSVRERTAFMKSIAS